MFYPPEFESIYQEGLRIILSASGDNIKGNFMNVNEECLLKYLKSPDELSYSTDILKLNNQILEQHFLLENILTKNLNLGYNKS